MSGHKRDDRDDLDDFVAMIRRESQDPPPAPRDRMWERIAERREARPEVLRPDFKADRWARAVGWAAAVAAVLAVGVFMGRRSATIEPDQTTPRVVAVDSGAADVESSPYAFVTLDLLDRADALLTDFRTRACADNDVPTRLAAWADGLLAETRLLLDVPDLADPEMKKLLRDLELTLAQLARLSDDRCTADRDWIRNGLEERDTVRRLRVVAEARRDRTAL